jgi:hypothetical protein
MSAILKATELYAVFFESLPNDRFSNAELRSDFNHTHGLIKLAKLIYRRVKVSTTASNATLDTEFDEPLSDGLGANPKH